VLHVHAFDGNYFIYLIIKPHTITEVLFTSILPFCPDALLLLCPSAPHTASLAHWCTPSLFIGPLRLFWLIDELLLCSAAHFVSILAN
jgi:hypothetical protein